MLNRMKQAIRVRGDAMGKAMNVAAFAKKPDGTWFVDKWEIKN
jgi:hypothetical protein